ncbi:hypothetical protein RBA63_07985 [Brenneria goodwinii]|uniref:Uncharacterized protein n=1 Tax=Brenneria goodwinii TaxID=1109412 RepID=A0A0G4JV69_9GAMM|nr:hypothetical protein [Brenneria goodwinii]CPR16352.1 hypothetical protein BN1221_02025c [Brenneria goodwinii]
MRYPINCEAPDVSSSSALQPHFRQGGTPRQRLPHDRFHLLPFLFRQGQARR